MRLSTRTMRKLDDFLHRALDSYIDAHRPGWGTLQVWQHRVCDAFERRFDEEQA
jgi:hypothetical protein